MCEFLASRLAKNFRRYEQFFRRVVTKQTLFTCPRRNGIGNMIKCRACRLDKCLVAGMDPTLINVPQSDKFKQFLANLKKRKMNKVKCRGCRLDKCLVAGMDPTLINVPHSTSSSIS
ncbi:hypothetical protein niasHT_036464 [Heterodera trifolii]|uniref:Nuclear receptor domain-containing protein n=1 Tax=Heterodera trifolii TaxID=157864 RepID=A0ABD2IW70_9BILA